MCYDKEKIFDFIVRWEGFEEEAYQDGGGVWTVGYGFTWFNTTAVKKGDTITREEADKVLREKIDWYIEQIEGIIKRNLSTDRMTALLSFAFNLGIGALRVSTLKRKINKNQALWTSQRLNPKAFAYYKSKGVTKFSEFHRWFMVNGRWSEHSSRGLCNRRMAEHQLWHG